jgi:hypothetical protein
MPNTNPQLYKVATQQLKVLRTLAKMSSQIGDLQGAAIVQAAETAIEHRIQISSMNLSALKYLEKLISQGHDYADAEWRTSQCYATALVARFAIDSEELRKAYDDRLTPTTLSPHQQALLEDIIAIADGMDILDRGSPEFKWAQQNLDRTIGKLDDYYVIDAPTSKLKHLLDSTDHRNCRELASQLLGDCQ